MNPFNGSIHFAIRLLLRCTRNQILPIRGTIQINKNQKILLMPSVLYFINKTVETTAKIK